MSAKRSASWRPGRIRPARAQQARWGWHCLTDDWAERVVARAAIRPGDLVLDIGAGTGSITAALEHAGARVLAFELHPRRCALLRERFAGISSVTVVQSDAAQLRLPHQPFRVVANPPFALTGSVLRCLLAPGSQLAGAHLVLQRANARRWAAGEVVAARTLGARFDLEVSTLLPRSAFSPRPSVDTAVLAVMAAPAGRSRRGRAALSRS